MKRLFSLMLAALMVLPMACVHAETQEITFQNIPWGISVEEAYAAVMDTFGITEEDMEYTWDKWDSIRYAVPTKYYLHYVNYLPDQFSSAFSTYCVKQSDADILSSTILADISVLVDDGYTQFIFLPPLENADGEAGPYTFSAVEIEPWDGGDIRQVIDRISSVYGPYDEKKTDGDGMQLLVWHGGNDTQITVFGDDELLYFIHFSKGDVGEQIEARMNVIDPDFIKQYPDY